MNRVLQGKGVIGTVEKLKRHLAGSGGGGGGKYKQLLIRQDESAKVRLLQNPEEFMVFWEHYDGDKKAFVPAIDNDPLANHPNERVKRASERFMVNVLNMDNGQVQVLKMSKDLSNRFLLRYQRNGTLLDRPYEIMRTGTGLETTYEIEADAVSDLDLSQFKGKLIDMEHYLLEQVDNYYNTNYADEYLQSLPTVLSSDAPLDDDEVAPIDGEFGGEPGKAEPATKPEKTQAELDAENPLMSLDDDEEDNVSDLPWETEAEVKAKAVGDPWAEAKAEGLPCAKGPDDLCLICSFPVESCVVKS